MEADSQQSAHIPEGSQENDMYDAEDMRTKMKQGHEAIDKYIEQLQAELKLLKEERSKMEVQLRRTIEEHQQVLHQKEDEKKDLLRQLEEAKEQLWKQSSGNQAWQQQLEEDKQKLLQKDEELANMKIRVERIQIKNKTEIERLQHDLNDMEQRLVLALERREVPLEPESFASENENEDQPMLSTLSDISENLRRQLSTDRFFQTNRITRPVCFSPSGSSLLLV